MGFGADIKAKRQSMGLSLRAVALESGISATYLSKIEREEFKPCGVDKIRKIADVLELDRDITCLQAGKIPHWIKNLLFTNPVECIELLNRVK